MNDVKNTMPVLANAANLFQETVKSLDFSEALRSILHDHSTPDWIKEAEQSGFPVRIHDEDIILTTIRDGTYLLEIVFSSYELANCGVNVNVDTDLTVRCSLSYAVFKQKDHVYLVVRTKNLKVFLGPDTYLTSSLRPEVIYIFEDFNEDREN